MLYLLGLFGAVLGLFFYALRTDRGSNSIHARQADENSASTATNLDQTTHNIPQEQKTNFHR